MKKRYLYLLPMAAALLASCGSDEEVAYVEAPQEILLGASFDMDDAIVTTRNQKQNLQSDVLVNGTQVGVFIYYKGQSSVNTDGYGYRNIGYTSATAVTRDNQKQCDLGSPTRIPYYPSRKDQVIDLYAFAPREQVTTSETPELVTYATTKAKFTTKADQTSDADYHASDFIWGANLNTVKADTHRNQKVVIGMNHKLSKICINLIEGHSMAGKLQNAKVQIHGVKLKGEVDLKVGTMGLVAADNAATDVTLSSALTTENRTTATTYYNNDTPTDGSTQTHYSYPVSCIVIPQKVNESKAANFKFLTVTLPDGAGSTPAQKQADGTKYDYLTSAILGHSTNGFEAGKVYTYNITINATGIQLTSVIVQNWQDGGTVNNQATFNG